MKCWHAGLVLLTLFACTLGKAQAATEPPPNVILVMTDDQGYGDLSCHGNPILKTPTLDRLYGQSIRLTDFHVDPTCSPTRSALLTGRYSCRTGVWHTNMGRSLLRQDEQTLADLFSTAGYQGERSPDRADAKMWASSELMLKHGVAERVRVRGV